MRLKQECLRRLQNVREEDLLTRRQGLMQTGALQVDKASKRNRSLPEVLATVGSGSFKSCLQLEFVE